MSSFHPIKVNLADALQTEISTHVDNSLNSNIEEKPKRKRKETIPLKLVYQEENAYEIGIDEAGRGPMFGRLYVAGVVLPKEGFDGSQVKDSKKYTSKKKIQEVYNYIKTHALSYYVHYAEADHIDKINIRQAVLEGMKKCATENMAKIDKNPSHYNAKIHKNKYFIMVDGDDFKPYTYFNETTDTIETVPHNTFVGGDHTYVAIAAASILAKVERDNYIADMCVKHPLLVERYGMDTHMGYGTKKHMEGIDTYGISQFHRKSYGRCKTANVNTV